MSCWVVPSVAAELWGCPVQSVLDAIKHGDVPTREENGWMFVDVAPNSPMLSTPKPLRPSTFETISDAELVALTGPIDDYEIALEVAEDDQDPTIDEFEMVGDWREVRAATELRRRAPAKAA
jgi:hypothetical protein